MVLPQAISDLTTKFCKVNPARVAAERNNAADSLLVAYAWLLLIFKTGP
jgi:hypothetical protein